MHDPAGTEGGRGRPHRTSQGPSLTLANAMPRIAQERLDEADRGFQIAEALRDRRQIDAVGVGFRFKPPSPQSEDKMTASRVIHGGGHLCHDTRMPVWVGQHQVADVHLRHVVAQQGESGPSLECRPGAIGWVDVVERPAGVKDVERGSRGPDCLENRPIDVARRCLEAHSHSQPHPEHHQ